MSDETRPDPLPTPQELLLSPLTTEQPQDDAWNRTRCSLYHWVIDALLNEECRGKVNPMEPASTNPPCPCGDFGPSNDETSTNREGETAERRCVAAAIPRLYPCIHVSWGDSDCDCMESDDTETVCVTVCNCYTNVTFADLSIQIAGIVNGDGTPVATLPDGTPSVEVIPPGPICFGDVGPCVRGRETCVSRQLVVRNRGAKAGTYKLLLGGVCFDLVHHYFVERAEFTFTVCKD